MDFQDIAIIGAGMVGAAAAIGLGQLGYRVILVENHKPKPFEHSQALDLRVSAISLASEKLLAQLGALDSIHAMRSTPYLGLETWEIDNFITCFHAEQLNISHLGHIVENRVIQLALWQKLKQMQNISLYCPAKVDHFKRLGKTGDEGIKICLDNGENIHCRLLVAADGADSQVRNWAGIGISGWEYSQHTMLINIQTSKGQQDITWQQFTPQGPRALLPLPNNHASLVWYDSPDKINRLMQLSLPKLTSEIKQDFPARLDKNFKVLERGSFPLIRRHAQSYYADNLVLLGDAAHSINPLAGQGVNLGFKDVNALIQVLTEAKNQPYWWANSTLKKYQDARYRDNLLMMTAMDAFYAGFSNDLLPLKILRNIGLKLADKSGIIKQQVLKYALGM